ncbi:MAG: hypothetical protein A3I66_10120 [Burkholderiales bacterium RIFCSPLOWO2_02_FULL_57_36]|nr:MAG: hypothetical protein A3I66_10120 [Burkholderiales bacterium RIFCSPLOWO2_02_FULL_57_36]
MLNPLRHSLRIGISRTRITLLKTSGLLRPRANLLANAPIAEEAAATPERLGAQLDSMLAAANCSRLATTIVLSDDWTRLLMVTPPKNSGSLQDCRAAADMRFQNLYGEPVSGWMLEADWDARHAFLACAIRRPLLDTLQQTALKNHLKLISITPQFIAMWNRWKRKLQANAWFGAAHADMLTLGAVDGRRLCAVRTVAIPAGAWQEKHWLPEHLSREALRLNLPMPSHIQLCGSVPGQWATQTMGALTCTRLDACLPLTENGSIADGSRLASSGMRS